MSNDPKDPTPRACPDCGYQNPADALHCESCNFPLTEGPFASPAAQQAPPAPAVPPPPRLKRLRERRDRRRSDPSMTLWLVVGGLGAIALLYVAIQGFQQSNFPKVEGARPEQQARADELRAVIRDDSTNVAARISLGDVLYDTGNWPDAIVEYRAAVRMDSSKVEALVDLGVCYYNLGFSHEAQRHFELALVRNPRQTIALFNLGIVHERHDDPAAAISFYERALATEPPAAMRPAIVQALDRARQAAAGPAPGGP